MPRTSSSQSSCVSAITCDESGVMKGGKLCTACSDGRLTRLLRFNRRETSPAETEIVERLAFKRFVGPEPLTHFRNNVRSYLMQFVTGSCCNRGAVLADLLKVYCTAQQCQGVLRARDDDLVAWLRRV